MEPFRSFLFPRHLFEWALDLDHSFQLSKFASIDAICNLFVFQQIGVRKGLDTFSYRNIVAAKTSDLIVALTVGASQMLDLVSSPLPNNIMHQ